MATSREPLGIAGEQLLRLPPLGADGPDADGVRLFIERARRVDRQFEPTSVDDVMRVCRRLDGLPLAIELAAARVAALSVGQILEGLEQRFALMSSGPRTAPPRHQTVAECVDWSYRLLEYDEQRALRRLSVFRGPFGARAAAIVLAPAADDALGRTLRVLAALVEKSLLAVGAVHGEARYRLLETVRDFASMRLGDMSYERTDARDRHLDALVERAESIATVLEGDELEAWIVELKDTLPDIRAAVGCAAEHSRPDAALRLVGSLWRFWWIAGSDEGWCRRTVDPQGMRRCNPGTGASVAQVPGPRPESVTNVPEPLCPL